MKILFVGPMGAGKSTAIGIVSDIAPISTEVSNSDKESSSKATTTVAMDYGEIALGDGVTALLYGIPGQERFSFMWPILAEGAMGAILLLDDRHKESCEHLIHYLDTFRSFAENGALIVGVGHVAHKSSEVLAKYRFILEERSLALPLLVTDVRVKDNVLFLIELLISNAEVLQLAEFCD